MLHLLLKNCDFLNTDISQGSVVTHLVFGGVFKYSFVTNFLLSLSLKEFWKSVNIWWSYGQEFGVLFFETQCTIIIKQYHFVTSSDWFPVPVRSTVKSNFTNWCCQNLSKRALNAVQASTTELGKLLQIFTMRAEKNAFVSHNEKNDFAIYSGCLWC